MHYLKRLSRKNGDDGVSPVVGVMLMLVVTIIIAAVVSGFAGGLMGGSTNQKTPTLAMDVKITNTGTTTGTGLYATVLSISDPTATKNLKIITSWATTLKDTTYGTIGTSVTGGATITGSTTSTIPYGFGPGVSGNSSSTSYTTNQNFGNYTLMQGTGLIAEASSSYGSSGTYQNPGGDIQTILGSKWEELRTGDIVTVRVIYIPTGKVMLQKDVVVTGA
jgi:archaeal type IV pilus assembly protein PilA